MTNTQIIIIAIFLLNLITLILYAADKRKAIKNKWRIPERVLLSWSFLAPWGAFAGMRLVRHKTQHKKFTVLVPVFMVLHVILVAYLVYQYA